MPQTNLPYNITAKFFNYIPPQIPQDDLEKIQSLHEEYQEAYEEHKQARTAQGVGKFVENDPYQKFRNRRKAAPPENQ